MKSWPKGYRIIAKVAGTLLALYILTCIVLAYGSNSINVTYVKIANFLGINKVIRVGIKFEAPQAEELREVVLPGSVSSVYFSNGAISLESYFFGKFNIQPQENPLLYKQLQNHRDEYRKMVMDISSPEKLEKEIKSIKIKGFYMDAKPASVLLVLKQFPNSKIVYVVHGGLINFFHELPAMLTGKHRGYIIP